MGFAAEVQHSLAYLRDHPDYPALVPRRIPYEFASELRDTLLKEIRQKELDVGILYENYYPLLVSTDRFAEELQRIYEPYFKIGLKPGNDLKVFLLDYLSGILGIVPIQQFTDEQSYLAWLAREEIIEVDLKMYYRLEYAIANHLCHHRSDSWILTSLGETVLHLPELEATRMLLALETFFHSDQDQHSFCMPLDFPEKLLNMGSIQIKAPWDYEKNLYDYSERLVKYRLMAKGEGSYNYNYVVTHLGQLVLESIVAKDSIYDTLIPVYIREMIVGSEASRFSSAADFQRLRDVVTRSTIAGDLRQDILDEIFRLQQANSAYPSIFTALAPKVEGLLRNLCKVERIELTDKTDLGAFIGALKKAPVEILKPATLEMLNCIFRPFRNIVEHGYSIPEEPARLMCQLSLNVIEQIHSDHAEYKQRART